MINMNLVKFIILSDENTFAFERAFRNLHTIPVFPIFLGKEAMVTLRREDGCSKGENVNLENS